MKANEKRVLKGYKIKDSVYCKAMKRSQKDKGHLSTFIEFVVQCYSEGMTFKVSATRNGTEETFDLP